LLQFSHFRIPAQIRRKSAIVSRSSTIVCVDFSHQYFFTAPRENIRVAKQSCICGVCSDMSECSGDRKAGMGC
jgi:hypothetical protein